LRTKRKLKSKKHLSTQGGEDKTPKEKKRKRKRAKEEKVSEEEVT
jgi:hypothetical protein